MKLKNLHIDSYKIFRNFDIDFCVDSSPADIIAIAGVNGTGKTTLLKEVLSRGGGQMNNLSNTGNITFVDSQFPNGQTMDLMLFANLNKSEIQYLPASQVNLSNLTSFISQYVDKIIYEDNKTSADAYKEIQQMIDSIFKDFQLGTRFYGMNRNRELIFENVRGEQFGVDGLSDGEKQILSKVFPLFTDEMKGKVILMDEPEESLHPSWQFSLIPVLRQCAKQNDCQFILATHSPQIISSVRSEELRLFVRTEENDIKVVTCDEGPYGWTVEKVLNEIQKVNFLRVPEVEEKLLLLGKMIEEDEYTSDEFSLP